MTKEISHTLTVDLPDVDVEITDVSVTCGLTGVIVRGTEATGFRLLWPAPQGYMAKPVVGVDEAQGYTAAMEAAIKLARETEECRLFSVASNRLWRDRS